MELVYGPIRSLRFGTTMGINLLSAGPFAAKVCSYNCAYCDLGPTLLTMNKIRKDFEFPLLDDVRAQFKEYIKRSVAVDAVVVSGSGEPTLYPEFEVAMRTLVELRDAHLPGTRIVVLTNGAHLDQKKVIAGLNLADDRVVKVDAGNDNLLNKLNAPLIRLNMAKFLGGFRKLKDTTVQSMFLTGEIDNTKNEMIEDWIEVLGMIKPRAVQLHTLHRPSGVNKNLFAVPEDTLYGIAFKLKKRTGIEAGVFTLPTAIAQAL